MSCADFVMAYVRADCYGATRKLVLIINTSIKNHLLVMCKIFDFKINIPKALLTIVFPRMQADKVSLCAKRDNLICAFGSRYPSTHREQH